MAGKSIRLSKRPDPFQAIIDARLAAKRAAEARQSACRPIAGVEALRDLAEYMREHPVTVIMLEVQ